jgi:hypothetical protein
MSELEAWAQNRLGPYVEPEMAFDGFVGLQSIPDESEMIVRWLLKTAIIIERALPMADTVKVASTLYPVAAGAEPPRHFWAWAASIVETDVRAASGSRISRVEWRRVATLSSACGEHEFRIAAKPPRAATLPLSGRQPHSQSRGPHR